MHNDYGTKEVIFLTKSSKAHSHLDTPGCVTSQMPSPLTKSSPPRTCLLATLTSLCTFTTKHSTYLLRSCQGCSLNQSTWEWADYHHVLWLKLCVNPCTFATSQHRKCHQLPCSFFQTWWNIFQELYERLNGLKRVRLVCHHCNAFLSETGVRLRERFSFVTLWDKELVAAHALERYCRND